MILSKANLDDFTAFLLLFQAITAPRTKLKLLTKAFLTWPITPSMASEPTSSFTVSYLHTCSVPRTSQALSWLGASPTLSPCLECSSPNPLCGGAAQNLLSETSILATLPKVDPKSCSPCSFSFVELISIHNDAHTFCFYVVLAVFSTGINRNYAYVFTIVYRWNLTECLAQNWHAKFIERNEQRKEGRERKKKEV